MKAKGKAQEFLIKAQKAVQNRRIPVYGQADRVLKAIEGVTKLSSAKVSEVSRRKVLVEMWELYDRVSYEPTGLYHTQIAQKPVDALGHISCTYEDAMFNEENFGDGCSHTPIADSGYEHEESTFQNWYEG